MCTSVYGSLYVSVSVGGGGGLCAWSLCAWSLCFCVCVCLYMGVFDCVLLVLN